MYQLSHLVKQKILDLPLIESLAKTLYYGTGLSLTVIDQNHNTVFSHGPNAHVDDFLEDIFHPFVGFVKDTIKNHGNGVYTYDSDYALSYLVTVVADASSYYGSLLLGPFLTKEANEHLINEVMHEQNFSMSKREQLKDIFNLIPILSSSRNYYIQQLVAAIVTNPHVTDLYPEAHLTELTEEMVETFDHAIEIEKSDHNHALEVLFLTKVQSGDIEKVIDLYNEHIKAQYFSQTSPNHLRNSKNKAIAFSTLLSRTIITGGVEAEKSLSLAEYYAQKIEQSHNFEELIDTIERMIIKYTNSVLQLSNINHVSVIKNASKYVHLHLSEPIRLNDVANYVNLSPNYFSSLFKREMNLSFADYVNQTRVKESQYLLETTNYSILDIAISVGYNNQNYFTTIFRKFTGVTPKQYRMRSAK